MDTKKILIITITVITVLSMIGIFTYQNKNNQAQQEQVTEENQKQNENQMPNEEQNNNATTTSNADTSSIQGLNIEILKQGTGEQTTKNSDKLTVNYVGTLEDGTKFDSSIDRGTPFTFTLGAGAVIKGWDLGLTGMKVGEKRKLTIQPELGYGNVDHGSIPANSTLIFEIELLKIN